MSVGVPALPLGIDPLIAEAKERARRRRRRLIALAAAGLVVAGTLAFELAPSGTGGGTHGAVPWVPTKPQLGPAHPPLAAACTASQLHATFSVQGAAGNLAGGIQIVNRSSHACALVGRPKLSLGTWRFTRWHQGAGSNSLDPLAPPLGSLRALPPGEHVQAQVWIPEYCQMLPGSSADRLAPLVLTAPGGGRVGLNGAKFPDCNASVSVQATRYTPFVPPGKSSSELPLTARIVTGTQLVIKGKRISEPAFVAHRGSWLFFTVVLKNHTGHVFRFGRTCPSYIEGFDPLAREQAYVLNCHPVGSIGPWQSVRFAMRLHIPRGLKDAFPAFGWSLAPHSYNAPQTLAIVQLR